MPKAVDPAGACYIFWLLGRPLAAGVAFRPVEGERRLKRAGYLVILILVLLLMGGWEHCPIRGANTAKQKRLARSLARHTEIVLRFPRQKTSCRHAKGRYPRDSMSTDRHAKIQTMALCMI